MPERTSLAVLLLAAMPAAAQLSPVSLSIIPEHQRDEAHQAYQRGEERMQVESFEEAVHHFRTAIRLDPMHWLAHYSMGQAQMALKRYPEAVQAYLSCRDVFTNLGSLDVAAQNTLEKVRDDEIRGLKDSLLRVQQGKIKTGSTFSLEVQIEDRLRVWRVRASAARSTTSPFPRG